MLAFVWVQHPCDACNGRLRVVRDALEAGKVKILVRRGHRVGGIDHRARARSRRAVYLHLPVYPLPRGKETYARQ